MSKEEYLAELERNLKKLPEVERVEAMQYYREYLEEAGENAEEVIEKLGSPKEVANGIIRECAVKSLAVVGQGTGYAEEESKEKKKNSMATNVWLIILGIFAAPIAFPFAIAVVAVIFALFICLVAVCFSVAVVDICFLGVGIISFVVGISLIAVSPITTVFFIGCSLFMTGFGIGAVLLTIQIIKLIIKAITWFISKIVKGGKKHEKEC
ncbi:MAG: DUF1700 domain-containing protein [Lachnospiraceae bacterium]|nr:DUF1700 domain-containing protein [Lachnospiraceae bacterium]